MPRQPVDPKQRPPCYGVSHAQDPYCAACPFRAPCATECGKWAKRQSLAEVAHEASANLYEDEDPIEVYALAYTRHFGKRLWPGQLGSVRVTKAVYAASEFCAKEGFDFQVYLDAQMATLKPRLGKFAFQPTMLLGAKARNRYLGYVEAGRRRYQTSHRNLFAGKQAIGAMDGELFEGQVRVGGYFLASYLCPPRVDWATAVDRGQPGPAWRALFSYPGSERSAEAAHLETLDALSKKALSRLKLAVSLRGAVSAVEQLQPGLSEWLGTTAEDFDWTELAQTVYTVLGHDQRTQLPLKIIKGHLCWTRQ